MRARPAPSRILTRLPATSRERPGPAAGIRKPMPDLAFLAAGLAFFALAAGYAALCARL